MRVALMTNNYKPIIGGVPISIERLAAGLVRMGHEVTIFAPSYAKSEETEQQDVELTNSAESGICEEQVFRYATALKHFIGGIVLPNPFDINIEREFRKKSYDIIHVHHPMLIGRTAVYLSGKYKIPLVFTYHTRYEQYVKYYTHGIGRVDKIMPLYLRTFLRHCDFVFAPTGGMQQYLTEKCRVSPEKTGVLPTGIDEKTFTATPEQGDEVRAFYQAERMPLLLTVSRMAQEKNVAFLLESLAKVKSLYGKPFRMLMIGEGPDKNMLKMRSEELGLEDTVIFTGTVPNERIAPYYKAADGFLFASRTETQGIVVLEAFAGGTPVIAVKATGVEDVVDDGINGFLTGEDTDEYAGKVTEFLNLLQGEDTGCMSCEKLSANAFQKSSLYREEAVARKAVRYYNDVIAQKAMQKKRDIRLLPAG